MRITAKQFDDFWEKEGQYLNVKNPGRFRSNLRRQVGKAGESEKLDEYVIDLKSRRETTRKTVVRFYDFIGRPDLLCMRSNSMIIRLSASLR